MKAKPRMLAPSECNTEAKAKMLRRHESGSKEAWCFTDGLCVTIMTKADAAGDPLKIVEVPVADMRKFARWFLRKQRCK